MKKNKIQAVLALSLSLVTLAGCSGATATISDGSDVLFTIGDTTVTREDEYNLVKKANGTTLTVELIRQAIMDEEIGRGDDIMEQADEQYETNASGNDTYEESLIAAGYVDKQDYIDKVIVPTIQDDLLMDKYFEENAEGIQDTYKPTIAKILMCDNKNDADNALAALQDGTDEQTVWDQYASPDATYGNEEMVVSTLLEGTLPTYVINTLAAADEPGVIDEVMTNDDNSADGFYYIAILVSSDYDENRDEIQVELTSTSGTALSDECLIYYMKKHNFVVYDQEIFDSLRINDPQYLVEYPELSETEE